MSIRSIAPRAPLSPSTFAPGARVLIRDEEWIVRHARPTSTGGTAVHVTGLSELVRNKDAIFLTELDRVEELRPEDTQLAHDRSPQYRRSRLFIETLLRRTPPTDERLYVGHRGAMNSAPYQLVPAAKALSAPRPRILIADGVGLGKTIEVGILLSELIQRGQGERILVVALKSILEQFQMELWARFTIPLVRLDSVGLERVRAKIPSNMNPFYYFNRVIISIDTLKKDEKYRRFLDQCRWDVVVVDECQNVAVRGHGDGAKSQRARLASLLARTCDSLVLTSATPHDGTAESFASLMNLLEPTAIANPSEYTKEDVRGLFVRRFKKDIASQVSKAFKERKVSLEQVGADPSEDAVFDALATAEFKTIDKKRSSKGVLFRTTLLKAFLSSPAALISTIDERSKHKDVAQASDANAMHDRKVLATLRERAEAVTPARFSKLAKLCTLLEQMGYAKGKPGDRVVIFSERIDTLDFLEAELTKRFKLSEKQLKVFHGSLDDTEQHALVKAFGNKAAEIRILLASDAASEGINLHFFCHRMIHFDIPWSLITLEQRNGRIDRYGQEHTPDIRYLLTRPGNASLKGDLRILDRLVEREEVAHKNLGDVAWLLDLYDPEKEEVRIGEAIEKHESPESVLPDEPPAIDFLSMLAETEAEATAAGAPETVTPFSLYGDDLAFARTAFEELGVGSADGEERPEFQDDRPVFSMVAPDDLRRRFAYLPRELRTDGWEFKLTTDRTLVQNALAKAREREDEWPEWQLFWNQHPIAGWLNDRVLGLFTRHEAPVIRVAKGLEPGESALIFQGIVSNARSRPVLVDWFAVMVRKDKLRVVPFEQFAEDAGLRGKLSNPATKFDLEALSKAIPGAVEMAREHMKKLRIERASAIGPALRTEQRRVKRWYEAAKEQLAAHRQSVEKTRKLRADEQRRLEDREKEFDALISARQKWIDEGLRTVDAPYVRIVAGVVRAE